MEYDGTKQKETLFMKSEELMHFNTDTKVYTQQISLSFITHTNKKKTFTDSHIIVTVLLCHPPTAFSQSNIKLGIFPRCSHILSQGSDLNSQMYSSQISRFVFFFYGKGGVGDSFLKCGVGGLRIQEWWLFFKECRNCLAGSLFSSKQ